MFLDSEMYVKKRSGKFCTALGQKNGDTDEKNHAGGKDRSR